MTQQQFLEQYTALPDEAQRQAADFIAFLRQKYGAVPKTRIAHVDLEKEPFIGMWKDRSDLEESSVYVRQSRKAEWGV